MRCKRHTCDSTSTIGVCSSCLRERLLSLAASAAIEDHNNNNHNQQSKKSNNPPLLIFPRSVSPYVTRRKSDVTSTTTNNNRRFITTPQVDLVGISCKDFESSTTTTKQSLKQSKQGNNKKNSRFSSLFRARSQDLETDPRFSCDVSESSSSSSRSWFTTILSGGRSKKEPNNTTTTCYIEDVIGNNNNRRPQRVFCRGMSPARDLEPEEEEVNDHLPEETPGRLKNTPAKTTPGRKKSGNGLGMGFCLSPLVRASPNCPFKRKMRFSPSEFGNSGEVITVTTTEKPHISAAASFCANRSKKLVDLGRVNRRR